MGGCNSKCPSGCQSKCCHPGTTDAKLPTFINGYKFRKYKFSFENLVLEGGGAKGAAYIGALKILDDAGILKNIKRIGGTSAGSIVSGFLAIGMSPQEILDKLNEDLQGILLASPSYLCGSCKYLWIFNNLINHFGMFPADKFVTWYGKAIEEHLRKIKEERQRTGEGDPNEFDNLNGDITFAQVYNAFAVKKDRITIGRELCTVTYEPELQVEEYCHVKTTPLLEIRKAVRMSMSIPVVFEAYQDSFGKIQPRHIDGGMSANYPIYCFEGWWLSMKEDNSFGKRFKDLTEKQLKKNFLPDGSREHFHREGHHKHKTWEKTLGLCLFSDTDLGDEFQRKLEDRLKHFLHKHPEYTFQRPSTKLANEYGQRVEQLKADKGKFEAELRKDFLLEDKIMKVAHEYPDKEKMKRLFDEKFTREEIIQLYGKDDKDAAFKWLYLDYNNLPTKTLAENICNQKHLQEAKNECLNPRFANTSVELYTELLDFIRKNKTVKHDDDADRSVGINVDYITTMDFNMQTADKQFLIDHGAVAAVAFLEHWVTKFGLEEVSEEE